MSLEKPTPEQIAKLPKWAQEHIENLDRRAVIAERTLKEYYDNQTPSEFFIEDYDSSASKMVKKYIQTHKIAVERNGVHVEVILRLDEKGIDISYWSDDRIVREIALVPKGFNSITLIAKEHMR